MSDSTDPDPPTVLDPPTEAPEEDAAEAVTESPTLLAAGFDGPEAAQSEAAPPPPPPSPPAPDPASDSASAASVSAVASAPVGSEGRRTRGVRQVVVAGIAGGVVGALVAAGMYTVFDDKSTSIVQSPPASDVIVRPSDRIESAGDIAAILKADVPAVVAIVDDGGPDNGGAAGTGFVLSGDGVIVTNNHVVDGADKIQAQFSDGKKLDAKVLGTASGSDLAVLQVDGTNLPTIQLGDSDAVQVGDDVVAIGNALALEGGLSVTRGIVSGLHRDVETGRTAFLGDAVQTDAAINPGNSGGPLVDSQGRVIGINTAIADPSSAQNVGFAIPISQVKSLISELREGRHPAFLGVSTQSPSTEDGAVIASVTSGSPGDKGGLQKGDLVVQVGSTPVHSAAGLKPAIRRYKAGEEVDVVVTRDGKRITLHVTLGEATEADS